MCNWTMEYSRVTDQSDYRILSKCTAITNSPVTLRLDPKKIAEKVSQLFPPHKDALYNILEVLGTGNRYHH